MHFSGLLRTGRLSIVTVSLTCQVEKHRERDGCYRQEDVHTVMWCIESGQQLQRRPDWWLTHNSIATELCTLCNVLRMNLTLIAVAGNRRPLLMVCVVGVQLIDTNSAITRLARYSTVTTQ